MISLLNRICRGVEDAWTAGFIQFFVLAVLAYMVVGSVLDARENAFNAEVEQAARSFSTPTYTAKRVVIGPDNKRYLFKETTGEDVIDSYFVKQGWQLRNGKWFSAAGEQGRDIELLPPPSTNPTGPDSPLGQVELPRFRLISAIWDEAVPIIVMMFIIAYEIRRRRRLRLAKRSAAQAGVPA